MQILSLSWIWMDNMIRWDSWFAWFSNYREVICSLIPQLLKQWLDPELQYVI